MDPKTIGRKIKELYPAYANAPDELVGQKFILKYGDKGLTSLGITPQPDPTYDQSQIEVQLAKDINAGTTYTDLYKGYKKEFAEPILRGKYNEGPMAKKWGPAKETIDQLEAKPEEMTADQKNRVAAMQPALAMLDEVSKIKHPEKDLLSSYLFKYSLQKAGGRGVPKDIATASAQYAIMKQNVVRALQGARMSDKDIELADTYIPTIIDTEENAKIKLENLKKMLDAISAGTYQYEDFASRQSNRPSLDSFVK